MGLDLFPIEILTSRHALRIAAKQRSCIEALLVVLKLGLKAASMFWWVHLRAEGVCRLLPRSFGISFASC